MSNRLLSPAKSIKVLVTLALLGVLVTVVAVAIAAGVAEATFTAKPANPTNQTTATFSWTHPSPSATFQCKLDSGGFAACSSSKTLTGLKAGSHTFTVRSIVAGQQSTGVSYTWTVDTTPPPVPTFSQKPPARTNSASATFAFTDADATAKFQCALDTAPWAACTSPQALSSLQANVHTFQVRAIDPAGNVGAQAIWVWTVDQTPPPAPVLTQVPDPTSFEGPPSTFAWTDAEPGVSFKCKWDSAAPVACASPTGNTLTAGTHTFMVYAVDAALNWSTATTYKWTIVKDLGPLPMKGNATGLLYPGGPARTVPVSITNPYGFAVKVTQIVAGVAGTAACGAANFAVTQSNSSAGALTVVIPANSTVTLPRAAASGGTVTAPAIRMLNLPTNQDGCQQQSVTLTYSSVVTK